MVWPIIAATAAVAGNLFGKKKGARPELQQNSSQSGFAALPPEIQQAYLQRYLPAIQAQFKNPNGLPLGPAETGHFASRGLQQLQNHSNQIGGLFPGTTNVSPLGGVEPFNPLQEQALNSFGGGLSGLQEELPGYQSFYNENVLDPELAELERQQGLTKNNFWDKYNLYGAQQGRAPNVTNATLGSQLAGLEDIASQRRLQARTNAFQGGQQLRRQTLQDMLTAGSAIQQQGQSLLDYLQPHLMQTTPQGFAAGLAQIPTSSVSQGTHTGAIAGKPNAWAKIGAAGETALGLRNFFGGGGGNAQGNFLNNPYQ